MRLNVGVVAATVMLSSFVVACGGGGGGGTGGGGGGGIPSTPTPTPGLPASATQSVSAGSAPVSTSLGPISAGYSTTVGLPATSSGSATLSIVLSGSTSSPALQNMARRPQSIGASGIVGLAYVSFTPTATVSFPTTPSFTFVVNGQPTLVSPTQGYIAFYDPASSSGWTTLLGPLTIGGSSTTWSFAGGPYPLTFKAGTTYVFALFTAASAVATPTPTPTASPTPTPSPSPSPTTNCASSSHTPAGVRRAPRASGGIVPNRLYVTYKTGVRSVASVERSASVVRTTDLGSTNGLAHRAITLASGVDAETMAATLRRDPSVQSVDRLHYRGLLSDAVANDQYLNNDDQWYLYKTNVDAGAWALSHGAAAVSVAVIDTGVDETNTDFVFDVKEKVRERRQDDRKRQRSRHQRPRHEHLGSRDRADEQPVRLRGRRLVDAPAGVQDLPRRRHVRRRAERRHGRRGGRGQRRRGQRRVRDQLEPGLAARRERQRFRSGRGERDRSRDRRGRRRGRRERKRVR